MKKLLLFGVPLLVLMLAMPILAVLMVTMSTQAAAECRTQQASNPTDLGDLGAIDGPVGGPVGGTITFAQANIPRRSGLDGFRASMPKVLSKNPDFVTLNEASGWTLPQIKAAAPGYDAFRVKQNTGDANSMGNVVLWKRDTWSKANGGRVTLVVDDKTYYKGKPVTWDRFATWVILQRADGAVVPVISTHHMTNPHKWPRQHGNPPLTRPQQYGAGMDILLQLVNSLATHGPVLIGGDMNTHASYTNLNWSAAAKMQGAGFGWHNHSVDFIFFPRNQGARLAQGWDGTMVSDHHWIAAKIKMNGAGPSGPTGDDQDNATTLARTTTARTVADKAAPPSGDVVAQLTQLRFSSSYPRITTEQARNAIAIAQVARDLQVPRYGLQIAIATAIQESKLVNLPGGDRDSGGLFQQRPSTGWGSRAQVTNPTLAARAFFGRAQHTANPGLLDINGWQSMPLTQAAQAVQRSGFPDAYAQWETVAGDITDILGGDLPDVSGVVNASSESCEDGTAPITMATLNILGAGHTDGEPGGGKEKAGYETWDKRLPDAMNAIDNAGASIAALQEVHGPQAKALATRYSTRWGMYPAGGKGPQNRVVWDRNVWDQVDARLVDVPYFGGKDVGMPMVLLRSIDGTQSIWVWSIHNPANTQGNAAGHRREALRRQLATLTDLAATGTPTVIMGDFNDGGDGKNASHCVLTPTVSNAFGGSAEPCKKPKADAPIDHIYGTNLTWASGGVDRSTIANKITDHPLVSATTVGSTAGCALQQGEDGDYNLGAVKPQLRQLVNILAPMFDIKTVGGYRPSATDPNGHPAGLAADFMVPMTAAGRSQGDALAAYAKTHARELGIDYIIWWQRIWSLDRASEGWRAMEDRGSATENHRDHVHINVKPGASVAPGAGNTADCGEVVYPVAERYIGTDRRNWHETGPYWSKWHTGTDFSVPCGTPVYAATAGTVEIDTTQGWAGPWLVKVTTGPKSVATWYAHMRKVTVSRGDTVRPGQQIGEVGQEGNGSGCHLHFEVHERNGSIYGPDNVDPSTWLAKHVQAGVPV